jgi:ATP-dependent Clp protease adapter protein ClpS
MVTPYHLLAAILDDTETREAIVQAAGSIPELSRVASSGLQRVSSPSVWERLVAALERPPLVESSSFRSALHRAWVRVRSASQAEVGVVDVLIALFRDAEIGPGMKQSGFSRRALLRYHCHGLRALAESESALPAAAQSEVLVFNDHYTEMETVVRILEKAFDMRPAAAFKAMMRVHHEGLVPIGPFPTDEAARRMQIADRMAEAKEAPLRLELRAARA